MNVLPPAGETRRDARGRRTSFDLSATKDPSPPLPDSGPFLSGETGRSQRRSRASSRELRPSDLRARRSWELSHQHELTRRLEPRDALARVSAQLREGGWVRRIA